MPKILVVDDDAAILKLVNVILSRAGHDVRTANHPVEALDLLQAFTPDLIISDVVMPYMTGLEFLEKLRGDERMARIPFMLLSSHAERADVRKGMNLGADDYLPKPFTAADLADAIDARLRRVGVTLQGETGLSAKALGTAGVTKDGEVVSWVSRKALELYFFLLENDEVTSWEAAEALWPEKDESRASSLFHTTLHRLRKSLGSDAVTSTNRRYTLSDEARPDYDVQRFELLAAQAEQGKLGLEELREVVNMYGEFLVGSEGPWVDDIRTRLEGHQLTVLGEAARLASESGTPKEVVGYLQQAISLDPLGDHHWESLAITLEDMGDTTRAEMAHGRDMWWDDELS